MQRVRSKICSPRGAPDESASRVPFIRPELTFSEYSRPAPWRSRQTSCARCFALLGNAKVAQAAAQNHSKVQKDSPNCLLQVRLICSSSVLISSEHDLGNM